MNTSPLSQVDFYKTHHYKQYPEGTTKIYSNLTPRKSRMKGINEVVVFGIGSYTYQYNTRDTFGFAVKATYGEVDVSDCLPHSEHYYKDVEAREIFKDPITDSGEKKSARGLLRVDYNNQGKVTLYQQQTKEQEEEGLLQTIFLDGKLLIKQSLAEIRKRLEKNF